MNRALITRSIVVGGNRVCFTLEEPVWAALKKIAHHDRRTLCRLVTKIDTKGRGGNLSFAIRTFVLDFVRANEARRLPSLDGHDVAPSMLLLAVGDDR
jgi:predicted DNA-binding ribbon-helix-helix protein